MDRFPIVAGLVIGSLSFTVGCATKNYVRSEVDAGHQQRQ